MADEIIGGVGVRITGDFSPLAASYAQAETAATQAGTKIAQAFNTSAGNVKDASAAVKQALANMTQAAAAFGPAAAAGNKVAIAALKQYEAELKAAQAAQVGVGQAIQQVGAHAKVAGGSMTHVFLGLKDLAEGNFKFFFAQMANQLATVGPAAMGATIGVAALVAVGYGIYELREYTKGLAEATVAAAAPFRTLNNALQETNDAMQVSNDKLSDEIAKLQGKPGNGLKLALDEATLAADQLGTALSKDIKALNELLEKHEVGGVGAFFKNKVSTSDLKEQMQGVSGSGGFGGDIAEITDRGTSAIRRATSAKEKDAAQTALNDELLARYSQQLVVANRELAEAPAKAATAITALSVLGNALRLYTGGTVDIKNVANTTEVREQLKAVIRNLNQEQAAIDLRMGQAKGTELKDQLTRQKEAERLTKEALKKEESDLRAGQQRMLDDLKDDHQLEIGEELQFWQTRLAEVEQSGTRYKELIRTIGHQVAQLQQESYREFNRARDKDQEDGERYQQAMAAQAQHWLKINLDAQRARAKEIKEAQIEVPVWARVAPDLAIGMELAKTGIKTASVQESDIAEQGRLLAMAQAVNVPLGTQLRMREQILQAQIDLKAAQGQSVSADLQALDALQAKMDRMSQKAAGVAPLLHSLRGTAGQVPGALGGAIAAGIGGGRHENVGQQVKQALTGIGRQMLGDVFTQLIQTILVQTGVQALLTAATSANALATGASAAATIGNTAATVLNTFWLAIKSFLGFADGGSPPVGVPSLGGERGPEVFIGQSGKASIIGAHGPQLFMPSERGTVIPNHMLKGFAGDSTALAQAVAAPSFGAPGSGLFVPRESGPVTPNFQKMRGFADGGGMPAFMSSTSHRGGDMHTTIHVHESSNPAHTARAVAGYLKSTYAGFSPASSR